MSSSSLKRLGCMYMWKTPSTSQSQSGCINTNDDAEVQYHDWTLMFNVCKKVQEWVCVSQWPNRRTRWMLALPVVCWGNSNLCCGNISHNVGLIYIDVSLEKLNCALRDAYSAKSSANTPQSHPLFCCGVLFFLGHLQGACQMHDVVASISPTITWQLLMLQSNALMRPSTNGIVCIKTVGMHCKTKW